MATLSVVGECESLTVLNGNNVELRSSEVANIVIFWQVFAAY